MCFIILTLLFSHLFKVSTILQSFNMAGSLPRPSQLYSSEHVVTMFERDSLSYLGASSSSGDEIIHHSNPEAVTEKFNNLNLMKKRVLERRKWKSRCPEIVKEVILRVNKNQEVSRVKEVILRVNKKQEVSQVFQLPNR